MTRAEAKEIMQTEKACCLRNIEREAGIKDSHCDRDCGKCDLVRTDAEIIDAYNIAIEALSPKHGEWISVENRLPENPTNKVLATVEYPTGNRYVLYAHYENHIGWWNLETDELFDESGDKVIAWQSLPEPYKQI